MKKIPGFIPTLLKVFAVHLLLFTLVRAIFMFANIIWFGGHGGTPLLYLWSFVTGFRFDANILCYAMALPAVLLFVNELFNAAALKIMARIILQVVLPLALFVVCADIPYYIQFQKHLTREALMWMEHGTMSVKLIFSNFNYWGYLILFAPLAYASAKTTAVFFHKQKERANWKISAVYFLLAGGLLALGIRGRLGKAAIHPGIAYTSENMLTNQAALNANFTVAYSYIFPAQNKNFFNPAENQQRLAGAKQSLGISGAGFEREVKQADTVKKLNVVVVLMESMSTFKTGHFGAKVLTPNLVKLREQGLWFSNFYSSGIHTYGGIFSTVTGYPVILHEHALENYVYKKFDGLPSNLKKQGYETFFFTTHDEQFDNMQGFLTYNGIDKIYSDKDFPSSASIGVMGVPDHVMFNFAADKLSEAKQPFFSLMLTASDHGPWVIPKDIPFKPDGKNEQDRATQYADWSIEQFLEKVRKEKWFDNTLFVFLGDHGANHGTNYHTDLAFNHIPCIFYCPKYIKPAEYPGPALQIDVFPTIMGELGYAYTNRSLGMDLLKEKRKYAYFSQDDRIGCLDDKYFYFYLMFWGGKEYLFDYKNLSHDDLLPAKRARADSMKNYAKNMLQTANYLITNQKY